MVCGKCAREKDSHLPLVFNERMLQELGCNNSERRMVGFLFVCLFVFEFRRPQSITSLQKAKDVYTGTTWVAARLFSTYCPVTHETAQRGFLALKGKKVQLMAHGPHAQILCKGVSPWDVGVILGACLHVFPIHVG